MDLGFAGLIEKIEERCGKHVASAIIWVLVLVVFAWGLRTLVESLAAVVKMMASSEIDIWSVAIDIVLLIIAVTGIIIALSLAITKRVQQKAWINFEAKVSHETRTFERKVNKTLGDYKQKISEIEKQAKKRIDEEVKRQG